jgi:hypothetical protein
VHRREDTVNLREETVDLREEAASVLGLMDGDKAA